MMKIERVQEDKESFIDLLMLSKDQKEDIKAYIEEGTLFALYDDDLKTAAVVAQESLGTYELKCLMTIESYRRKGYGKKLLDHIIELYQGNHQALFVATGDIPEVIQFFNKAGFAFSHRWPNFFIDRYERPVTVNGVRLSDMIYLKKEL